MFWVGFLCGAWVGAIITIFALGIFGVSRRDREI